MRGQRHQLIAGVRRRLPRQRGLDEPLRDEIGKTPIRRGRVGVGVDGQTEMPRRLIAWNLGHVLSAAEQLQHGQ